METPTKGACMQQSERATTSPRLDSTSIGHCTARCTAEGATRKLRAQANGSLQPSTGRKRPQSTVVAPRRTRQAGNHGRWMIAKHKSLHSHRRITQASASLLGAPWRLSHVSSAPVVGKKARVMPNQPCRRLLSDMSLAFAGA